MSNPLKEIAEAILALTYAEITELAKGIEAAEAALC